MGSKNNNAPKAPNYDQLAKTQAAEDRKTAQEITKWNRPNQYDSLGNSVEWTQDENGNWTQNSNLSAPVQQQYTGQINNANAASDLTGSMMGRLAGQGEFSSADMPTYDLNSGREVSDATYGLMTDRLIPQQQQDLEGLRTQLRLQGLQPGTQAYDDSMKDMMTSQGDVLSGAANQATLTGYNEARERYLAELRGQGQGFGQDMAAYTLPWQQAQQAQSMSQDRYNPTMPGFSGATGYNPADSLGAANAGYNAKMGEYNANQAKKGNTMNTAGTIASAAIKASDATLKMNIVPLSGREALSALLSLGGYTYDWKDGSGEDMGVLAQEVEKVLPELINRDESYLQVNYTGIMALAVEAIKYLSGKLGEKA